MNATPLAGTRLLAGSPLSATTAPIHAATDSGSSAPAPPDLLEAMNPAMDAAFAVGRPTDASGAVAILGTTGAYIEGARATIDRLDDGIELRRRQLELVRGEDPDSAQRIEQQLDLLQRLRDRIQLSIERVTETIASAGADDPLPDVDRAASRREELDLLEQRRQLLAGDASLQLAAPSPDRVAGTYASPLTISRE
jgi:hypothetical protein